MDTCEALGIVESFLHLKTMHSLTAETGSRSYHVYRDASWNNMHQPIKVVKERNEESINIDFYWIKLNLLPLDTYHESFRDIFFTSAGRWINNRICC